MKRTTLIRRLQIFHKRALDSGKMDGRGLCKIMSYFRIAGMFQSIFEPDKLEEYTLIKESTPSKFWGFDIPYPRHIGFMQVNSIHFKYTVRRQHLVLLMIELLKDEEYVNRHLKGENFIP